MKWHALRARFSKRGQSMTDLLPACREVVLQQLDVVSRFFAKAKELVVRHQQGGGEVVRQRDAAQLY